MQPSTPDRGGPATSAEHRSVSRAPSLPVEDLLEVSVVMPCLNEERTVAACVQRAQEALREAGIRGEVIVADNGSTDRSRELATAAGARVVDVIPRGYGAALAGGFKAATGRFLIMGDCDASYDFGQIPLLLARLKTDCDLVVGNRFAGGIRPGAMPFLHRYLGNPALTVLGRVLFRSPCKDIYCGLRGLRREWLAALGLQMTGMEFALEMVVKARLLGLVVGEVPVTLDPDGRGRRPHLNTWRDGWRSLRFLAVLSPDWLFLWPGLALLSGGLVLGALLLPGVLQLGDVRLDVHTLLYCSAAISTGLQLLIFAVLARALASALGVLPSSARLLGLVHRVKPEAALVIGLLVGLVGLVTGTFALGGWARAGFGDLDPYETMRLVIPSALAATVGAQLCCTSLMLGLLQIPRRDPPPAR